MTTTYSQDKSLHEAISNQLGDMSWLFTTISEIAEPEDIFSEDVLSTWAEENGFAKTEELEDHAATIATLQIETEKLKAEITRLEEIEAKYQELQF